MTTRLGAVDRAMVQVVYLYDVYPTHCHARLGVQYQCESLQVTINGATSRCQGVSTQHLGLLHVLESSHRGAPLK